MQSKSELTSRQNDTERYRSSAEVPSTTQSSPSLKARVLAFAGIITGGLLGSLTGYAVGDLLGGSTAWRSTGLVLGAVLGAVGVGIIAILALQAMIEWHETEKIRKNS